MYISSLQVPTLGKPDDVESVKHPRVSQVILNGKVRISPTTTLKFSVL